VDKGGGPCSSGSWKSVSERAETHVDVRDRTCGGDSRWQAGDGGGSGLGAMHGMRAKMELDVRIGRGIGLPSLLQPRLNHSKLMELGTGGHIQKFTWASAHVGKGYLIYFGLD
jgi:hypothetical protein